MLKQRTDRAEEPSMLPARWHLGWMAALALFAATALSGCAATQPRERSIAAAVAENLRGGIVGGLAEELKEADDEAEVQEMREAEPQSREEREEEGELREQTELEEAGAFNPVKEREPEEE